MNWHLLSSLHDSWRQLDTTTILTSLTRIPCTWHPYMLCNHYNVEQSLPTLLTHFTWQGPQRTTLVPDSTTQQGWHISAKLYKFGQKTPSSGWILQMRYWMYTLSHRRMRRLYSFYISPARRASASVVY